MKPQVELLVRPDIKDFRATTKFLERIARVCYQSEGKITDNSDLALIDKLLKSKHMAIFEHVGYTYNRYSNVIFNTLRDHVEGYDVEDITGFKHMLAYPHNTYGNEQALTFRIVTNRGVTHELVRHRQSSFAQESTRYVKYTTSEDVDQLCILPEWHDKYPELVARIEELFKSNIMPLYSEIMATAGVQMARGVLPNFLKSEIIMTFHRRKWFDHFLELRTSNAAHPEMRYIADIMKGLVYENTNSST